jgi:anti-sigma regulatory factor (Ser/Thr protein kinase)
MGSPSHVAQQSDTVKVEFRGEVCVVRCAGAESAGLADVLRAKLLGCHESGARDVLLDVDPCLALGPEEIAVLAAAARSFRASGGELVIAVEESEARQALAEAGLVRGGPPGASGEGVEPVPGVASTAVLPERPRWQHDFFFTAMIDEIPIARRRVASLAEVAGLYDPDLFEFSVAVSEALTNAVVHGSPHHGDDDVRVRFFCFGDEVAVEVVDCGPGIAASPVCSPSTSAAGGRGIHFMRALCDAVQFACSPLGTHVLLVKRRR